MYSETRQIECSVSRIGFDTAANERPTLRRAFWRRYLAPARELLAEGPGGEPCARVPVMRAAPSGLVQVKLREVDWVTDEE